MVDEMATQMRRAVPQSSSTAAGLYGDPANLDIVIVAAASGRLADPAKQLNQTFEGFSQGGVPATGVKSVDPGPLGGDAKCGTATAGPVPIVLCAWADSGSLGVIGYYFKQNVDDVAAEFVRARSEVEKRD
jgi:hypothetical protein